MEETKHLPDDETAEFFQRPRAELVKELVEERAARRALTEDLANAGRAEHLLRTRLGLLGDTEVNLEDIAVMLVELLDDRDDTFNQVAKALYWHVSKEGELLRWDRPVQSHENIPIAAEMGWLKED